MKRTDSIITVLSLDCTAKEDAILSSIGELCGYEIKVYFSGGEKWVVEADTEKSL